MEAQISVGHTPRSPSQPASGSARRPSSSGVGDDRAFEQYFNGDTRFETRINTIRTLMSGDFGPQSYDSLGGSCAGSSLLMSVASILQSGHAASADAEGMIESAIVQSFVQSISTLADASETMLSASAQSILEGADESFNGTRGRTSSLSINDDQHTAITPSQSLNQSFDVLSKRTNRDDAEDTELLSECSSAGTGSSLDRMQARAADAASTSSLSLSQFSEARPTVL